MAIFSSPAVDCADPQAVQRLYEATGRAALSKAEHVVGRFDVAQEIVQDVFLKLWQQKLRFPTEKQAYYWIYKACHNAGIDHLRSAAVRRERGVTPVAIPGGDGATADGFENLPAPGDHGDATLKRQLVAKALEHLEDREAAVLGYWIIDGMTQEEIAEVLSLSRKTIGRIVKRLEEKLSRLKEDGREHIRS